VNVKKRLQAIGRFLSLLLGTRPTAELRVPNGPEGPLNGIFNDRNKMAVVAAELSGNVPGIYVGLNPLRDSFNLEAGNCLTKSRAAIKDVDVAKRCWLPIDFDPVRPSGTPSSETEHEAALTRARECLDWLRSLGWPQPLFADSGNGGHLLYAIDLSNDRASSELVKAVLQALSLSLSDAAVYVDVANSNASRIWRVCATQNRKGKESDDRRFRDAVLLNAPATPKVVPRRLLKEMGSRLPIAPTGNQKQRIEVRQWLADHGVAVLRDAPWSGGYKWVLQCPWNEDHKDASAYIVQFRYGGVAAGCLHKSCQGNGWPDLRRKLEQRMEGSAASGRTERNQRLPGTQQQNQTASLIQIASDAKLFSTPDGQTYATVPVKEHRENLALDSKALKQYLRHRYFVCTRSAPRPLAISEAVSHLDAIARYDSPTKDVFVRVARAGDANYLDLADGEWRAVRFSAEGWSIVRSPNAKFRRVPGMLPLPKPVSGGNINELKEYLNLRSEEDWILFIEDLLAALIARGPYPLLGLFGEAGSAKSTTARVFRGMIDPHVSPSRATPQDIRDLMIMARNSWVLSFDNLSYLPSWFSDCLCRLSTGGGLSTRELYTNSDEVIFDGQRPLILNGIEELATRTDLLDRSILLELPVIENCKEERVFWGEFEAAWPRLLGALLDVAVEALRNLENVQLETKPRMADFATLATAAESALGLSKGAFTRAYDRNRGNVNAVAFEASPIAPLVFDLAEQRPWEGSAEDLLRKLSGMADEETLKRRSWPKTPKVLSGMLRRLATALRRAGIHTDFSRENNRQRTRIISIMKRVPAAKRPEEK